MIKIIQVWTLKRYSVQCESQTLRSVVLIMERFVKKSISKVRFNCNAKSFQKWSLFLGRRSWYTVACVQIVVMLADVFSSKSQPFDAGLRIQKYNTLSECESQTECSENFDCNNSDYPNASFPALRQNQEIWAKTQGKLPCVATSRYL